MLLRGPMVQDIENFYASLISGAASLHSLDIPSLIWFPGQVRFLIYLRNQRPPECACLPYDEDKFHQMEQIPASFSLQQ